MRATSTKSSSRLATRRAWIVAVLFAARGVCPAALEAQSIRGQVLEEGTGLPVAGAVVVVLDASGIVRGTTMTAPNGTYITFPPAGTYTMRVERIGYEAVISPEVVALAGETSTLRITVPISAIELQTIDVRRANRCALLPDEGLAIHRVWEEARKALTGATWTGTQQYYRFDAIHFESRLGPRGEMIELPHEEEVRYYGRHPFKSIPSRDLALGGYVQDLPLRRDYYGPDADVLISEDFLDRHCFALRKDAGMAGMIGLVFEPVGESELTDIDGVMWIHQYSSELQFIEFHYKNLSLPVKTGQLGGRVEFARLPSGAWIVRRWYIRTPIIGYERQFVTGAQEPQMVPVLVAIDEGGGEVTAVYVTSRLPGIPSTDSLPVSAPPDSLLIKFDPADLTD